MTVRLVDFGTPAFGELIHLRDLLLRKPLGLEFTPEQLSEEFNSFHFAAYDIDDNLMGTLVMKPLENGQIKMRQVAVYPEYQKQGVGQAMVYASENFSIKNGYSEIVLSARIPAIPFYEKLEYVKVGAMYTEVGIDHFQMSKKLN